MRTMDRLLLRSIAALWLLAGVPACLGPNPDAGSRQPIGGPAMSGPGGMPGPTIKAFSPPGTVLLAERFGGPSTDEATAVASDGCDGALVAGYFKGTLDIGGIHLTSAGDFDGYVARVQGDGQVLWARRFGGPLDDRAQGVAMDRDGDVLVAGSFHDTVDFGTGPLTSQGGSDGFIAAYAADGTLLWSQRLGGIGDDRAEGVAAKGDVVAVTGSFQADATFGGDIVTSKGADDVFVASYATDGTYHWSLGCGGAASDVGWGVAVDDHGNVAVTGSYQSTIAFSCTGVGSMAPHNGFVAQFSPAGAPSWSRSFSAAPEALGSAVAFDSKGDVALAGYFRGSVDVGGGFLHSAGDYDGLLALYTAAGAHVWSQAIGGPDYDIFSAIGVDSQDDLVVAGTSLSGAFFSVQVRSYSTAALLRWQKSFAGSDDVRAWGVAAGQRVSLAGDFKGTADLGGTPVTSAGDTDVFLVQFAP